MSNPDFIGIYDNALSSEECDELITFFESSKKIKGKVYNSNQNQRNESHKFHLHCLLMCEQFRQD